MDNRRHGSVGSAGEPVPSTARRARGRGNAVARKRAMAPRPASQARAGQSVGWPVVVEEQAPEQPARPRRQREPARAGPGEVRRARRASCSPGRNRPRARSARAADGSAIGRGFTIGRWLAVESQGLVVGRRRRTVVLPGRRRRRPRGFWRTRAARRRSGPGREVGSGGDRRRSRSAWRRRPSSPGVVLPEDRAAVTVADRGLRGRVVTKVNASVAVAPGVVARAASAVVC